MAEMDMALVRIAAASEEVRRAYRWCGPEIVSMPGFVDTDRATWNWVPVRFAVEYGLPVLRHERKEIPLG